MSSVASSTDPRTPDRAEDLFRLLMQVRLLIVGVTMLLLIGTSFTVSSALAIAAAIFSSWLGAHYWQRIMQRVVRHPLLLSLDVVVAFAVLELAGPLGPFFLFTVVTSAVAGLLFRWPGIAYFCSLQILCYYAALGTGGPQDIPTFQALVGQPAYYPLVGFVGLRIRRLLDERAQLAEARRQAEVEAAAAGERTRLSRELHDSLAKTLRGIAMSAAALPMWLDRSPDRAADEARRIASAAETGSREARELVSDLRMDAAADRPPAAVIHEVARQWASESGTAVHTELAEDARFTVLGRHEAVAVLKEALANIDRHARAENVRVTLGCHQGQGVLEIRDDGRGFDSGADGEGLQRAGHYGLAGMRERAARADGAVSITSVPGRGTTVRAAFPLLAEAGEDASGPRGAETSPSSPADQAVTAQETP